MMLILPALLSIDLAGVRLLGPTDDGLTLLDGDRDGGDAVLVPGDLDPLLAGIHDRVHFLCRWFVGFY